MCLWMNRLFSCHSGPSVVMRPASEKNIRNINDYIDGVVEMGFVNRMLKDQEIAFTQVDRKREG